MIGPLKQESDEPIIAWRAWGLKYPLMLVSMNGVEWHSDRRTVARCSQQNAELPPHKQCTCGLYAARTREWLMRQYGHTSILGEVELTGKIFIHEEGYRAQEMKVKSLIILDRNLDPFIDDLIDMYCVPVTKEERRVPDITTDFRQPPQPAMTREQAIALLKAESTKRWLLTRERAQLVQAIRKDTDRLAAFKRSIMLVEHRIREGHKRIREIEDIRKALKGR